MNVDVKATFHWLRDALLLPLEPNSRIFVTSSGAALHGSPLSGGYAGAKRTQTFIAAYAADEAKRLGLNINIQCLLPQLNPNTDLGRAGVAAYAERAGLSFDEYAKRFDPPLTPARIGASLIELLTSDEHDGVAKFVCMGKGLKPLP